MPFPRPIDSTLHGATDYSALVAGAATIPITVGLPSAHRIFDVVFLLVVVFTLVQGPTLPFAARWLGVAEDGTTRDVTIESAPLDAIDATLLQFALPQGSRLAGVSVSELRLPGDAVITLILRDGEIFVPDQDTVLRARDHLLLAASNHGRADAERRLRAVSRAGRLAGWYGERGEVGQSGAVVRRPDGAVRNR